MDERGRSGRETRKFAESGRLCGGHLWRLSDAGTEGVRSGSEGGGSCKDLGLFPHETLLERRSRLRLSEGIFMMIQSRAFGPLCGSVPEWLQEILHGKDESVDFPPKDRKRSGLGLFDQVQSTSLL